MSSFEDVLLMVNYVRHKKSDGTLYLMGERLAWMLEGKDTFSISFKYADIKTQKISPEGKSKIQLQIVLNAGDATTFHFINPAGADAQLKDRDDVKELLQQLLPKFKPKVNKELEEKNRILQENPHLYQLYCDLVTSQVISAEEFWANYAVKVTQKSQKTQQEVGVSAAFLADIKPQTDGCNGLKYNITADIIESIFRTYPAVKRKHMENVPHKLSESEFWTRFFQSHYFHRDRLNLGTKDLFSECSKSDEQDIKNALKVSLTEPLVNINSFEEVTADEDANNEAGKAQSVRDTNQSMIRRFNHHSMMVLQACKNQKNTLNPAILNGSESVVPKVNTPVEQTDPKVTVNGKLDKKERKAKKEMAQNCFEELVGPSSEEIRAAKKMRLHEKTEYEDLESNASVLGPTLTLTKRERYLHGPIPIEETKLLSQEEIYQATTHLKSDVATWDSQLTQVLSSTAAISALGELSRGGALMASSHVVSLKETIPTDIQKTLRALYSALCELLRHFWLCFPTTTPQLEEKVVRMRSALERFQYAKLQPFHDQLLRDHYSPDLTTHLTHMLELAYNKFNLWQSRQGNISRK